MSSVRPEKPIASSWWMDKLAMALVPAFGTALSRRWEDEQSEDLYDRFSGIARPRMITHGGTLPNRRLGVPSKHPVRIAGVVRNEGSFY